MPSRSCQSSNYSVITRSNHSELVILDWDDTVFPTDYLLKHLDYAVHANSGKLSWSRLKAGHSLNALRRNMTVTGSAALRMLKSLYSVSGNSGRNALIVTSGVKGWVQNSLVIAATLSPIWQKVGQMLQVRATPVIYARRQNMECHHWKLAVFQQILSGIPCPLSDLHVLTIGDQWTDHILNFKVSHHMIKLAMSPNAQTLAAELHEVAKLLADTNSTVHQLSPNQIVIHLGGSPKHVELTPKPVKFSCLSTIDEAV